MAMIMEPSLNFVFVSFICINIVESLCFFVPSCYGFAKSYVLGANLRDPTKYSAAYRDSSEGEGHLLFFLHVHSYDTAASS